MMEEDKVVEIVSESNDDSAIEVTAKNLAAEKGDLTRNLEHIVQTA
ncbi:MAG: hypothetical protein OEW78_09905 [Nitrosopumilus sp.]|nr:hypothetical protein [Nitrosopumilus sp.]MDH5432173.1 hypothetical protein [Nitrosopumilus sp.]